MHNIFHYFNKAYEAVKHIDRQSQSSIGLSYKSPICRRSLLLQGFSVSRKLVSKYFVKYYTLLYLIIHVHNDNIQLVPMTYL